MTLAGIYKITSPSGRIYIGQSLHIKRRWAQHSNPDPTRKTFLSASIKKYGAEAHSFEVVHELPIDISLEVLTAYEQFYMDHYKLLGFQMMNEKEAGIHGKLSEELKAKLRISGVNKNKGRVFSAETRMRMSVAKKGLILSEEHKQKIRLLRAGVMHTEETKQKMSAAQLGKSKQKWAGHSGNQWKAKKVIDTSTGQVYETITKAADSISMKETTLCAMLKGQNRNRTSFSYADSE